MGIYFGHRGLKLRGAEHPVLRLLLTCGNFIYQKIVIPVDTIAKTNFGIGIHEIKILGICRFDGGVVVGIMC